MRKTILTPTEIKFDSQINLIKLKNIKHEY